MESKPVSGMGTVLKTDRVNARGSNPLLSARRKALQDFLDRSGQVLLEYEDTIRINPAGSGEHADNV